MKARGVQMWTNIWLYIVHVCILYYLQLSRDAVNMSYVRNRYCVCVCVCIYIYKYNYIQYIYMKSSDAKASKCHLQFSCKISIFSGSHVYVQFFHFNDNENNLFIAIKVNKAIQAHWKIMPRSTFFQRKKEKCFLVPLTGHFILKHAIFAKPFANLGCNKTYWFPSIFSNRTL